MPLIKAVVKRAQHSIGTKLEEVIGTGAALYHPVSRGSVTHIICSHPSDAFLMQML
jgi:hypothetical protein